MVLLDLSEFSKQTPGKAALLERHLSNTVASNHAWLFKSIFIKSKKTPQT